jgi:hypothetical protein
MAAARKALGAEARAQFQRPSGTSGTRALPDPAATEFFRKLLPECRILKG